MRDFVLLGVGFVLGWLAAAWLAFGWFTGARGRRPDRDRARAVTRAAACGFSEGVKAAEAEARR